MEEVRVVTFAELREAGIPAEFYGASLQTFSGPARVSKAAGDFVGLFQKEPEASVGQHVYFQGGLLSQTRLIGATMVKGVLSFGLTAKFVSPMSMLTEVFGSVRPAEYKPNDLVVSHYEDVDLVVFDLVDVGDAKDWRWIILQKVILRRVEEGRPTSILSHLPPMVMGQAKPSLSDCVGERLGVAIADLFKIVRCGDSKGYRDKLVKNLEGSNV